MATSDGTVLGATQIAGVAPRGRAFNVVLLADGFTAGEQAAFDDASDAFVAALSATPPFGAFGDVINVFRVNVTSAESGADDPVPAGGTGRVARTFFDATFGHAGVRHLLVCDNASALVVAATHVPEFAAAIVVVNAPEYGGSGGTVATYSLDARATDIALHEIGHSAFGLADEYATPGAPQESGDVHAGAEPREPNVTANTDRATLKWRGAVAAGTALPTMRNPDCRVVDGRPSPVPAGTVGLFEGARYFHCGVYRPEFECKMRVVARPFCRVCRDAITARLSAARG